MIKLIKIIAFVIPFLSGVFYFILPNPITLFIIAGIWAALGLPIVNIGALFLISKLEKELQPKTATKMILWTTLCFQVFIGFLLLIDNFKGI